MGEFCNPERVTFSVSCYLLATLFVEISRPGARYFARYLFDPLFAFGEDILSGQKVPTPPKSRRVAAVGSVSARRRTS